MRLPVSAVLLTTVTLLLGAAASANAQSPELEFVAPELVTANLSGESSEALSVWIRNTSDQTVPPEFKTILEDADGNSVPATVEIVGDSKSVGPDQVERFRLILTDASKSSGQLVGIANGVAPASVQISVGPKLDLSRGVNGALIIPFLAALILIVVATAAAWSVMSPFGVLGTAELEFSKAFASTLTAVGALLGTIISASVLPEDTVNLSKEGFTGLNLTFGIAIAVAGIVYSAMQKSFVESSADGKKREWKLKGYTIPFLLASLITVWAVFGEIWTMWRLFEELGRAGQGFSDFAVTVVQVLLGLAVLAMIPYTVIRIRAAVRKAPEGEELESATVVSTEQSPPTVSLL